MVRLNNSLVIMFLISFALGLLFIDRLCYWGEVYTRHRTQLEHDSKMINLCKNETIGTTLAAYATTCVELEARAREGAFLSSFRVAWGAAVLEDGVMETARILRAIGWPTWLIIFFIFFVLPPVFASASRNVLPYYALEKVRRHDHML